MDDAASRRDDTLLTVCFSLRLAEQSTHVIARASLRSPKQSMRAAALSAASGLLRRSAPRNDAFIARSAFIARRAFIGRLRPFIARSAFILGGLLPAVAFAQDLTVCAGKGYTLTSNVDATGASEVTYEWYESVNGAAASTIPNSNTPSISIPGGQAAAGTYYYSRKAANAECPGGVFSNTYTVVVAGTPVEPTDASANARCGSGTVTFSATVPDGITIDWYTEATGGSIVSGGSSVTSFSPDINESTTYYAQARNTTTGCESALRLAVGGTVSALPVVASVSGATVCANATTTLTATVSSGVTDAMTYTWIVGSTSSTTSVNTKTTQALSSNTAFTVTVTNANGCTSAAYSATITITSKAAVGQPANDCGCASGANCFGTCQTKTCTASLCSATLGYAVTYCSVDIPEQKWCYDTCNAQCAAIGYAFYFLRGRSDDRWDCVCGRVCY